MPYLIATADGNLTAAATWGLVDSTTLLDSESNFVLLANGASWTSSAAATPGAITVDGIAVHVYGRAASPSGTMSVRIYNVTAGAAVAGTTVTINVSDLLISSSADRSQGWVFFKFAAPVLLLGATSYRTEAQTSAASQVYLFRDATASNICRQWRTTTTQAPVAGDNMLVTGEWTAAATKTNRAVTMDSTASTDYGNASTSIPAFWVCDGGTVTYGTTAATNYYLKLSGILAICRGGTFNMGTVATPMPRDSSAVLEIDCAADDDFAIYLGGTMVCQGLSRTSGKNIVGCLLNTDEAVGQTVLGVDTDTGWLNGDEIAIASTTRTVGQSEERVLNGAAGASSITVSAGLTNAHSGTAPTQAEVVLLTRNVRVKTTTPATLRATINIVAVGALDADWADFQGFGGTGGTYKAGTGIDWSSTGAVTFDYCTVRYHEQYGLTLGSSQPFTCTNTVFWKVGGINTSGAIIAATGQSGNITLTDVWVGHDTGTNGYGVRMSGSSGTFTQATFTRLRAWGGSYCLYLDNELVDFILEDVVLHTGDDAGFYLGQAAAVVADGLDIWRCNSQGLYFSTLTNNTTINNFRFFGNNGENVYCTLTNTEVRFMNGLIAGDTSFATARGFYMNNAQAFYRFRFENVTFGVVTGIYAAHTTADFDALGNVKQYEFTFINCTLASATEFSANFIDVATSVSPGGWSFIARHRKDGTTNTHEKNYLARGTVAYETTTFRTAAPSEKLTPIGGTGGYRRLPSSRKRVAVASGQTATVSAYVRKDGTYNGNAPRLILCANPALGIDNDTVLDTMTSGSGVWEQLTGSSSPVAEEDGVLECYVDCDGSAGNVFVDDWSATVA